MSNHTLKATVVIVVAVVVVIVEAPTEFNAQAAAGIPITF
jgi:hypothetical protein